jgi:hypothetical protein
MDVRNAFVPLNRWGGHRPCPVCRPDGIRRPPDLKHLTGVMRVIGQLIATGKLIYACFTCKREEHV